MDPRLAQGFLLLVILVALLMTGSNGINTTKKIFSLPSIERAAR